jgi:hypothetical protein
MEINQINSPVTKPLTIEHKGLKDVFPQTIKDSVEMGSQSGKIDYPGIVSAAAGGVGGAVGGFYLGERGGMAAGIIAELLIPSHSINAMLTRLGWGALLGGIAGAVSGALCGALLARELTHILMGRENKEEANPDVARVFKKDDNFDKFKGVDLGFAHIGSFTEAPHQSTKLEKMTTKDVAPDADARGKQALKVMTTADFNPDASTMKINPEATVTHRVRSSESFRGIALGKHVKIGKARKQESDRISYDTEMTFKAQLPYGAQASIKGKLTLKADQTQSEAEKSGFMR